MIKTLKGRLANGIITPDEPIDPAVEGEVMITLVTRSSAEGDGQMLRLGMFPELRGVDVEAEIRAIREESERAFERKWGLPDASH